MVRLLVFARHELVDPSAGATLPDATLLLEGSWPSDIAPGATDGSSAAAAAYRSLDDSIDGRFDWIDRKAADLAELLGRAGSPLDHGWPAYLNALALRYYLVKLIRPLAYFTEVRPLGPGDRLELVAATKRDTDYAELLWQYCRVAGADYRVRWVEGSPSRASCFPANGLWRRCVARLAGCFQPPPVPRGPRRRVVLCGNPRLLDPVCRELLTRGCDLWWLTDRFAVRSWLRWQAAGVAQLACNSSLAAGNRLRIDVPQRLECRGVDLAGPVRRWLTERLATHGPRQTRLIERIDAHFRRVRPDALVLDEDATPLTRAAVAVGRRYGAGSLVVQHGAPYCRFGFTPPAADRILVWGRSSRRRLIDWGVPAGRIRVTGSPQHDLLCQKLQRPRNRPAGDTTGGPARILLLATVPPRDHRPDAVALHLTGRTYARMLRMAFAAVAAIDGAELPDGAELIIKLHPRGGDDPVVRSLQAEFRSVDSRLVRRGRLEKWLAGASCVLSCASSAGVEATLAGLPVIQLAPPGASGFLAHVRWGLLATARSEAELRNLLARVVADGWPAPRVPDPSVFAGFDGPAAGRIADEVLAPIGPVRHQPCPEPTPKPHDSICV